MAVRCSKKSNERGVTLPGIAVGESFVELLALHGFRPQEDSNGERVFQRRDSDGIGYFAVVVEESPQWLILGTLLDIDVEARSSPRGCLQHTR